MIVNPVPWNIWGPKKLDDFFKEVLEEQQKKSELYWDSTLERIQQRALHVSGPLSKVGVTIVEANNAKDEKDEIPLECC